MDSIPDNLTDSERKWMETYRSRLRSEYPGVVKRMMIFGSKARGDAKPGSDLDVLLIVSDGDVSQKRRLRRIGYALAAGEEIVPSILVYTLREWEYRKKSGSYFRQAVEQDQVSVL